MGNDKPDESSNRLRSIWDAIVGLIATIVGLLPHVLHHIGLIAGTAFITGAGGTILFGAIGLVASAPFLVRMYKRFNTWKAPLIALAIFIVMFSLSAFIIGPAIRSSSNNAPVPTGVDHEAHH